MFKSIEKSGLFLGFAGEWRSCFFFFGSRHMTREGLAQTFPQYKFSFLKQVHGCQVNAADPAAESTADGHFTSTPGLALVVQTADCVPVLLAGERLVCALHAGWRGVAQNIVYASSLQALDSIQVAAIGPHIAKPSFEVGRDVAEKLNAAAPGSRDFSSPAAAPGKRLFDLEGVVRDQLRSAFGAKLGIQSCSTDSKTDARFHSFRRDGAQAGRQYSFVVINS